MYSLYIYWLYMYLLLMFLTAVNTLNLAVYFDMNSTLTLVLSVSSFWALHSSIELVHHDVTQPPPIWHKSIGELATQLAASLGKKVAAMTLMWKDLNSAALLKFAKCWLQMYSNVYSKKVNGKNTSQYTITVKNNCHHFWRWGLEAIVNILLI